LRIRYVSSFVALPKPASPHHVFRPTRRVSWATRIFAILVLLGAIGATVAIVLVILPARIAALAASEAQEMTTARSESATAGQSLQTLWADLGPAGPFPLTADKLAADLSLAQTTEKQANDALTHLDAARTYLTQAAGVPFQLHAPAFVQQDQPQANHLDAGLQAAVKLAHAASLQLALAQSSSTETQLQSQQLGPALAAHNWASAVHIAAGLETDLQAQQLAAANPDALLDPLWGKWFEARFAYSQAAQEYALNAASGQTVTAQQLQATMNAQATQVAATLNAAQQDASAWQLKTYTPLLKTISDELGH
jgi:hypothetical protein